MGAALHPQVRRGSLCHSGRDPRHAGILDARIPLPPARRAVRGLLEKPAFVIALLAAIAIAVFAADRLIAERVVRIIRPMGLWHYRMTVQVETPEGLKTGSAVRQVTMYKD